MKHILIFAWAQNAVDECWEELVQKHGQRDGLFLYEVWVYKKQDFETGKSGCWQQYF
jgi:hypothetical protein